VITTSLDKTVALWTAEGGCELSVNSGYAEAQKFAVPGGPAFCTLLDRRSEDGLNDQVYLGTHGKSVMAWVPPAAAPEPGVALADHCGWVRALAVSSAGRWLFSAACKEIRQWDNARTVPSAAGTTTVEKGDVLAMVAGKDRLYTAGADGSVRSFVFGKKAGLTPAACRPKAHGDRVCALALGPGLLYSASYDGSIKAWDLETLEIVAVAQAAHSGERVASLALGPGGGVLYSGGGDCMVRRWHPGLLSEAAPPLHAHHHPVGVVAAGPRGVLVSGDAGGEVAVWRMSGAGDCKASGDSGCNNNFLSY
jgi:WD40 repeat protein